MTEGSLHWMAVCTMQQSADVDFRWSRFRLPARGSSSRRSYDEPRVQPPNREASLRFLGGCCRVNSGQWTAGQSNQSNVQTPTLWFGMIWAYLGHLMWVIGNSCCPGYQDIPSFKVGPTPSYASLEAGPFRLGLPSEVRARNRQRRFAGVITLCTGFLPDVLALWLFKDLWGWTSNQNSCFIHVDHIWSS